MPTSMRECVPSIQQWCSGQAGPSGRPLKPAVQLNNRNSRRNSLATKPHVTLEGWTQVRLRHVRSL